MSIRKVFMPADHISVHFLISKLAIRTLSGCVPLNMMDSFSSFRVRIL